MQTIYSYTLNDANDNSCDDISKKANALLMLYCMKNIIINNDKVVLQ